MNNIDYTKEIHQLKKAKDVLILAHYYVEGPVQDIADHVGDSYYLSQIALEAKEKTILFCGVTFMAESAKILSPSKTILMPDYSADCPMVYMVSPGEIHQVRKEYDDLAVVCYINSTSEIKALADVCVTSANALKIVANLKEKNIFFVPDQNLGRYVEGLIPEKNFIFNKGFCCVHNDITKANLLDIMGQVPDAEVIAHPECTPDVLKLADFIASTTGILDYINQSNHTRFIVCTEVGIFHQLKKNNPDKEYYMANNHQICNSMKKITLKKVYDSLLSSDPGIIVDENISKKARKSLERMHRLAKL